jgi:hypothetical protein
LGSAFAFAGSGTLVAGGFRLAAPAFSVGIVTCSGSWSPDVRASRAVTTVRQRLARSVTDFAALES